MLRLSLTLMAALVVGAANADPFIWLSGGATKNSAELYIVTRTDTNPWWTGSENGGAVFRPLHNRCGENLGKGCGPSLAVSYSLIDEGITECKFVGAARALRSVYFEMIALDHNGNFIPGSNVELGGPKHGEEIGPTIYGGWYIIPHGAAKVVGMATATAIPQEGKPNVDGGQLFLACH